MDGDENQLALPCSNIEMLWKVVHSQQQQLRSVQSQLDRVSRAIRIVPFTDEYETTSDGYASSVCSSMDSSISNYKSMRREMKLRESFEMSNIRHPIPARQLSDDSFDDGDLMTPEVRALIKKYTIQS
jgi:hypothetical protein